MGIYRPGRSEKWYELIRFMGRAYREAGSMKLLLVFALFAVSAYCQELVDTGFKQCGTKEAAEVIAVNIEPCDRDRKACILKKSTKEEMSFSTISIKFKAKRATELPIFSKVSGKLGPFKKDFTVIPSACKKVEKPLEAGQEYIFSYKLPISRFYPKVHVVVEWNLVEGKRRNEKEILCVQMNTKLA